MSLISLPPELQLIIASNLPLLDLLHLLSTTHYFYSLLSPLHLKVAVEPKGEPQLPALLWATQRGHEPLVRLLLAENLPERYKTDVDIIDVRNGKYQTALHIAAQNGFEGITRVLLEKGANVDAHNSANLTPLSCAAASINTTPGIVRILLENAADFARVDASGNTVLHDAASCGRADVIRVLVEEWGINVDIRNHLGDTPLLAALDPSHKDSAEREDAAITLLELGADPRLSDNLSPLCRAHLRSSEKLIAVLLRKLLPLTSRCYAPYFKAEGEYWYNHYDDGRIALLWAAYLGDINMVRYLLSVGISADSKTYGAALVHRYDDYQVRGFLSAGILAHITTTVETALHRASAGGNVEIINLLLESNADINKQDETGWTPLHFAAKGAHVMAVAALLEKGADVNARNDCGITALHWAVRGVGEDAVKIVEILLEYGAYVGDGEGEDTVFEWALEHEDNEKVIERLLHRVEEERMEMEGCGMPIEELGDEGWHNFIARVS